MAVRSRRYAAWAMLQTTCSLSLLLLIQISDSHAQTKKPPPVRDVTPPEINRVYRSIENSANLGSNLPKFDNIQVLPNGNLRSGTKTIQLYGMRLPERNRLCTSSLGTRWTCGVTAFVALRNLVESRSIACNIMLETEQTMLAQCSVEQTDIAPWMLQEGWAELATGVNVKIYTDAAAQAKSAAKGLWGNDPPPVSSDRLQKQRW